MELLGLTSYVCFAVALVALVARLRTSFMLLVVTAPLTTVAAFNISDSSVLIYHLVWLAFTVRFVLYELGERTRLDTTWLPFLLWCLCSIPLVLFHTDTVVLNIDDVYANAAFSTQQLTQWAYLLIAIATAVYAECLLRKKVVFVDDVIGWLEAGLVLVLAIALLQQFMSVDFMNTYFRNSAHTGYNWNTSRLSSTFSEPSFLSLYISPLVALVGVRMVYRSTLKGAVLIVGSLLLCLQNQSSSAVVGVAIAAVVVTAVFLGRSLKVRVPHAIYLVVIVAIAACTFAALAGAFDSIVSSALSKLSGEGNSGTLRSQAFNHMMGVFADNFVLGIGYGTVRSYDLVSTWLSELGIVGCALFFAPFAATVVALLRGTNSAAGGGCSKLLPRTWWLRWLSCSSAFQSRTSCRSGLSSDWRSTLLGLGSRSALAGANEGCRARRVRNMPLESLWRVMPNGRRLLEAGTPASKLASCHKLAHNSLCSCPQGVGAAA